MNFYSDNEPNMIAVASELNANLRVDYQERDVTKTDLGANKYDAAVAFQSPHWIEDFEV